jgi:hypothetical protein
MNATQPGKPNDEYDQPQSSEFEIPEREPLFDEHGCLVDTEIREANSAVVDSGPIRALPAAFYYSVLARS